jgi:hypothetical protein
MLEIPLPILFHRQPPSKLAPYESRISPAGNLEVSVRSRGRNAGAMKRRDLIEAGLS